MKKKAVKDCMWVKHNVHSAIKKIRSLRLHAAQAYIRHIFEHKINV